MATQAAMTVGTENQETRWYETDFMRALKETCDSVATELCHDALAKGLVHPYEIEFFDDRSSFAELTVNENEVDWRWGYPIRYNQSFEGPGLVILGRAVTGSRCVATLC